MLIEINTKNIAIIGLIIIAGIVAFFWIYQSDEARIKKRFTSISELAAKDGEENELMAALKARKIADVFAKSCRIDIPSESISQTFSKDEIPPHVMAGRARYSRLAVKFYDIQIKFPDDNTADVDLTASVAALTSSNEPVNDIYEVRCALNKIENDWFFTKIEEVEVLEK